MTKKTCDECHDEYPHKIVCPDCEGDGAYTTGTGEVYEGQCSRCLGTGEAGDPNEGKGFQVNAVYSTTEKDVPFVFNVSLSTFHEGPDLCGKCLPKKVLGVLSKVVEEA